MTDAATEKTPQEKIAFVNAQPLDMKPEDVVQKGKEAGVPFSRSYVYHARNQASKAATKTNGAPKKERNPAASSKATKAVPRKRPVQRGDKAAFVRTMPDASVQDVVKAAQKQGIQLTAQAVYTTRYGDAKKKKRARGTSKAKKSSASSSALAKVSPKGIVQLDRAADTKNGTSHALVKTAPKPLVRATPPLPAATGPSASSPETNRVLFAELVLSIGVDQAYAILSKMRSNVASLVR